MHESTIEIIIESLEGLAATDDRDQSALFTSALSSVRASASRALIPNTRLGALARYSVAASASASLKAYLQGDDRSATRDRLMRAALRAAFHLAEGCVTGRKDEYKTEAPGPEGWERSAAGVFVTETPVGTAEIFHNPHMPGGDWTLNLCGLPVGHGSDPEDCAQRLPGYLSFMEEPQRPRRGVTNPFSTRMGAI